MKSMTMQPYFFQTAWYCMIGAQRVYLVAGTPEEKAKWKNHKRMYKKVKGKKVATGDFPMPDEVRREWGKLMANETRQSSGWKMKVKDLAAQYLTDCEARGVGDILRVYRYIIGDFVKYHGHRTLDEITPARVREWHAAHKKWKSTGYVRCAYKRILQIFNWAVKERIIPDSPLTHLELPKETKRELEITPEDEATIMELCHVRFRDFFFACMQTGRRPNEIAGLRKSNVVILHGGRLGLRIKGKNYSKTHRHETIPLNSKMEAVVQERMTATTGNGFLFPSEQGSQYLDTNWNRPLRALATWTAIDERYTMYCTRHTYITRALKRGVPIGRVARLVGNSQQTILQHYSHLDQESADDLLDMCELATAS